ncbi:probable calcium-binding protein CML46 [Lolium rigidum]|uniref:probable calcium-binding protein CML46 n=1 Tax=Lolium rigidum TaxID=89674 RepID=UPI001F5D476D|nr:probable calcium-binding protein CML46 [Lolium rigidum]
MAEQTAPRPLLRRVLSFREPLLVIPYLISFLAAAASAFFHSYASFLQSFARSLAVVPSHAGCAKCTCTYASSSSASCCADNNVVDSNEEEEEEELRKEEVEAIMARIGLGVCGTGEGLKASMGRAEVSRLFDAEEPSFAEVRRAFAVFDGDKDGLIGAADLQAALARLGFREDAASCEAMIAAASRGSGSGSGMNLFQFVTFLEDGLC